MRAINEDIVYNGRVIFSVLPDNPTSTLTPASTTPLVTNGQVFESGGTLVSITNFLGAADGQTIRIRGDGFTTLVHGTYIKTNTGANKLLAANRLYTLTYFNDDLLWIEH